MGPRPTRPAFTLLVLQGDQALAVSRRVWGSEARLGAIKTQLEQANVTVLDLNAGLATEDGLTVKRRSGILRRDMTFDAAPL
jgi:esterase/lipase superfamily enzyme